MAEKVGFEPTVRYSRTAVFKTAALNHSATSPTYENFIYDLTWIWQAFFLLLLIKLILKMKFHYKINLFRLIIK